MTETLGQKQEKFAALLPGLIQKALEINPHVRLGDLFRDPKVHGEMGVKMGYGNPNSCHKLKLAIDINFIKDGKITEKGHAELHDYWDSVGGSERILVDMNHYSMDWAGYR